MPPINEPTVSVTTEDQARIADLERRVAELERQSSRTIMAVEHQCPRCGSGAVETEWYLGAIRFWCTNCRVAWIQHDLKKNYTTIQGQQAGREST